MEWDFIKRRIVKELAQSLNCLLPEIGGENWWQRYVLDELTPAQRSQVQRLLNPDLFQLDMAALLRVLDRNWGELVVKKSFPRDGRTLVRELMAVRNRWAHEPASGHDFEDLYRDLDSAKRLLSILSVTDDLIAVINQYRISVLSQIAESKGNGGDVEHPSEPTPTAEPSQSKEKRKEKSKEPQQPQPGASLSVIGANKASRQDASNFSRLFAEKTFIGIDFGTSTTVASYIRLADDGSQVVVEPIQFKQSLPDGRRSDYHLVPSCIALNPDNSEILFGLGAKELQYQLREGIDVWSSFKMELGIDLGPRYRNTKLRKGKNNVFIEKPQDAAREFFRFLRNGIDEFINQRALPKDVALAVSVPASFEANQRRDLIASLSAAGFSIDDACLIDEPNAAFLSVIHESWLESSSFIDFLRDQSRTILVFDFGAGTCDISVLRVSVAKDAIRSRNLSISRFIALGGNNIDRVIAQDYLLPQLLGQSEIVTPLTTEQIDQIVVPRLMPVAERLKIQCSKILAQRGISNIAQSSAIMDIVSDHSIPDMIIGPSRLRLESPKIEIKEFANVMRRFVEQTVDDELEDSFRREHISVFEPISSALSKANLAEDQIDAVLFIGGSSENPLIQGALKEHFGRFVDALVPRDLRTHVSQGAAFHAFAHHGFGTNVIQPITSESIMLVTANGGLETILSAGSEVPTKETFVSHFSIVRDDQEAIELPICVTSEEKILSVVSVSPVKASHFRKGQAVTVECRMTADKLLEIGVRVDGRALVAEQVNPLANTALTEDESRFLLSRQRFNKAVLEGNGRPPVGEVVVFARAASEAGRHLQAAELFEQIERMDPSRDFATAICYNYDRADRSDLADKWAQIAYERNVSATAAFNLAVFKARAKKINDAKRYLEEALRLDPEYAGAMAFLGDLMEEQNQSGQKYLERAAEIYGDEMRNGTIDRDDCLRLMKIARKIGATGLAAEADALAKKLANDRDLYQEDRLVGSVAGATMLSRR